MLADPFYTCLQVFNMQGKRRVSFYLFYFFKKNPFLTEYSPDWFDLFGFDGISTTVGYLMSNPVFTYIYIKYI